MSRTFNTCPVGPLVSAVQRPSNISCRLVIVDMCCYLPNASKIILAMSNEYKWNEASMGMSGLSAILVRFVVNKIN